MRPENESDWISPETKGAPKTGAHILVPLLWDIGQISIASCPRLYRIELNPKKCWRGSKAESPKRSFSNPERPGPGRHPGNTNTYHAGARCPSSACRWDTSGPPVLKVGTGLRTGAARVTAGDSQGAQVTNASGLNVVALIAVPHLSLPCPGYHSRQVCGNELSSD